MAISVNWNDSAALLAQLARQAGKGQLATRAQERAQDQGIADERFKLGLAENQRQNDLQLAFRAQQAAIDNQQQAAALAAQQQAQQQQLAANVWNQQQNRDASAYGQQLDYANAAQNRDTNYAMHSIDAMEQSLNDGLAFASKLNLSPEGKRKLQQINQSARAAMSQRGVTIRDGEAYSGVLSDIMRDFDRSGIDKDVVEEPTAYDDFTPMQGQQVHPGAPLPPGLYFRNTGSRNGVVTKDPYVVFGPEGPKTIPAPNGGLFVQQQDDSYKYESPIKEKPDPNSPKPQTNADFIAEQRAITELAKTYAVAEDGNNRPVNDADIQRATEQVRKNRERFFGGGQQGMGPFGTPSAYPSAVEQQPEGVPSLPASIPSRPPVGAVPETIPGYGDTKYDVSSLKGRHDSLIQHYMELGESPESAVSQVDHLFVKEALGHARVAGDIDRETSEQLIDSGATTAPPVAITTAAEAKSLKPGQSFTFNGHLYVVLPGGKAQIAY